jgi:DNA polymerase delta subunit 4
VPASFTPDPQFSISANLLISSQTTRQRLEEVLTRNLFLQYVNIFTEPPSVSLSPHALTFFDIPSRIDVITARFTMPATRKSTRAAAARAAASKGQSTLSFNQRVTKSGTAKSGKTDKLSTPAATKVEPERQTQTPTSEDVEEVEVEQPKEVQAAQPEVEKSEAELKAEKVSDAQIKRYWKGVEAARISKRVHQEDLSQAEKVLRYFDVSSQYGPCIGISRAKRWYRAEKLGLNPPIEVLAVLLREEGQGNKEIERAAMDRLMESTAIGSG